MKRDFTRQMCKWLLLFGLIVGFFLLLRPHVIWLDSFEGVLIEKTTKMVPTLVNGELLDVSEHYFVVEEDDGRQINMQVDQLKYFRASIGNRIVKKSFRSEIELIQ
jgi:hypothetical protein